MGGTASIANISVSPSRRKAAILADVTGPDPEAATFTADAGDTNECFVWGNGLRVSVQGEGPEVRQLESYAHEVSQLRGRSSWSRSFTPSTWSP